MSDIASIRRTAAYTRLMRETLAALPMCADPFGLHPLPFPACEAHHIIGLVARPDLAMCRGNLAPLCRTCHKRIEREPATERCFRSCVRLAGECEQPEIGREYMEMWRAWRNLKP